MKNYIIYFFTFLFCTFLYSQDTSASRNSNNSEEIEKRELRSNYMGYLTAEGYMPSIDDAGDIKFKSEGKTYYLLVKSKNIFTLAYYQGNKNGCTVPVYKTLNEVSARFLNITTRLFDSCDTIIYKSVSWLDDMDDYKGNVFKFSLRIVKNAAEASGRYYTKFTE